MAGGGGQMSGDGSGAYTHLAVLTKHRRAMHDRRAVTKRGY